MIADVLLQWMTALSGGSWSLFRSAVEWSAARHGNGTAESASRLASALETLGHAEFDWTANRWEVTPRRLVRLPGLPGWAVLTGGRSQPMLETIDALSDDDSTPVLLERTPQEFGPETIMVCGTDDSDLEPLAELLEAPLENDFGPRAAACLPSIDECTTKAPPAAEPPRESEKLSPTLRWETWTGELTPGLYRHAVYGRRVFRFASSVGDWRALPMGLAIYAELRRLGRSVLYWEHALPAGRLYVPARARMPAIHARIGTLCTGLLPAYDNDYLVYENVDASLAAVLATSLGQTLTPVRPPELGYRRTEVRLKLDKPPDRDTERRKGRTWSTP